MAQRSFLAEQLLPELRALILNEHSDPLARALLAMTCKAEHRERTRPYRDYVSDAAIQRYVTKMAGAPPKLFNWLLKKTVDVQYRDELHFKVHGIPPPARLLYGLGRHMHVSTEMRTNLLAHCDSAFSAIARGATVQNYIMFDARLRSLGYDRYAPRLAMMFAIRAAQSNNMALLVHLVDKLTLEEMNELIIQAGYTLEERSPQIARFLVEYWLAMTHGFTNRAVETPLWDLIVEAGDVDLVECVNARYPLPSWANTTIGERLGRLGTPSLWRALQRIHPNSNATWVIRGALSANRAGFLHACEIMPQTLGHGHKGNIIGCLGRIEKPWADIPRALMDEILATPREFHLQNAITMYLYMGALEYHSTLEVAKFWYAQLKVEPSPDLLSTRWIGPNRMVNPVEKLDWLKHVITKRDLANERCMAADYLLHDMPIVARWYYANHPASPQAIPCVAGFYRLL